MPTDFVVAALDIVVNMVAAEVAGMEASEVAHTAEVAWLERNLGAAEGGDSAGTTVLLQPWPVVGSCAAGFVAFVVSALPFFVVETRLRLILPGTPLRWTS